MNAAKIFVVYVVDDVIPAVFQATQFDLQDQTRNQAWTRCMAVSAQGMILIESASAPVANFGGACP